LQRRRECCGSGRCAERALQWISSADLEMPGTSGLTRFPRFTAWQRARVLIVLNVRMARRRRFAPLPRAPPNAPEPGSGTFGGRLSETLAERLRASGRAHLPQFATQSRLGKADSVPLTLRPMPDSRLVCLCAWRFNRRLHALSEFLSPAPKIGAPDPDHADFRRVHAFLARQIEAASGRVAKVAEEGLVLQARAGRDRPGRFTPRPRADRKPDSGEA
jgi:hypothetical protein